jgi:hypothetical protein
MDQKKRTDDEEEDERDRRATNIFLLVAGVLVVGAEYGWSTRWLMREKARSVSNPGGAIATRLLCRTGRRIEGTARAISVKVGLQGYRT